MAPSSARPRRPPARFSPSPPPHPTTAELRQRSRARARRQASQARQEAMPPRYDMTEEDFITAQRISQQRPRSRAQGHANNALPMARQVLTPFAAVRHHLGAIDVVCPCCQALHWSQEASSRPPTGTFSPFRGCCQFGRIDLVPFPKAPAPLDRLLSDANPDARLARHFRENIRAYNNALSFTSTGVRMDPIAFAPGGPPVFKIQGQLHHFIGSLLPISPDEEPQFLQVYIADSTAAAQTQIRFQRAAPFGVDNTLLLQLNEMMLRHNPWAQHLLVASERLRSANSPNPFNLVISTIEPWSKDRRRYNKPAAAEVAAMIPGTQSALHGTRRELIVQSRHPSGRLMRVHEEHSAYLPLRFVLILPIGTHGWCPALPQGRCHGFLQNVTSPATPARISLRDYHSFHLFTRQHIPLSTLHLAGFLMQEWVVDAAAAIEQMQLSWIGEHQDEFRSDTFGNLRSAVEDGQPLCRVGVRTLLPATHTGSPRYMYQSYHDCMAIVRRYGKPSLFITMTSNWNWRELRDALGPGQQPSNRPDLMARVFRLKLNALLDDLTHGAVFGRTVAHTYVVEYQKRGLPHAHILLLLHPDDRPVSSEDVDSITCAELPNKDTQPELWATVTSSMLHGPCGASNPSCVCMLNGRCKSGYPRRYQETTVLAEDGYPIYRRRDNNRTFTRNSFTFTNQWVVPYNPWLCAKYDCHINVEIASAIGAVKYLYKYVYKGNDRSAILVHDPEVPVNEISDYLDARRISPAEACYNIFSFERSGHLPAVTRLSVHLPHQNLVRFRPTADARATLRQVKSSSLEAFFTICREQPDLTRGLLYPDAPTILTWHKHKGKWAKRRQAKAVIGRVLFIPPAQGECFYLRMLLYHIPNPTSYEGLRTIHGQVYPTFQLACQALGLLEDDKEHDACLLEAAGFHAAHALRILFVTILIHSAPMDPRALYDRHKVNLFDDCAHQLRQPPFNMDEPSNQDVEALGLTRLAALADHHGRSLPELGLPDAPSLPAYEELRSALREERQYNMDDLKVELELGLAQANAGQRLAFDAVTQAVDSTSPQLFFLDGPGGTGKTFVERLCLAHVRSQGRIALAVASSGVASLLLPGGRTAHSRFKIPINTTPTSTCSVPAQSTLAQLFRETVLVVWDEAVMQHLDCIMAVDRMLQDIRDCNSPFGGVTMLFAGDLRQCLPVIPKGGRTDIINSTITNAPFWPDTATLSLQQNMRLLHAPNSQQAQAFASWLLQVGVAALNTPEGKTSITDELGLPNGASPLDLITAIYPRLHLLDAQSSESMATYFKTRIILAPHNTSVDTANAQALDRFPGQSTACLSADRGELEDGTTADLPAEYLNTLDLPGFPPHVLQLKQGAPIILLRNLAPAEGLCNGTRLIVLSARSRVLQCQVVTGPAAGNQILVPRIRLANNPGGDLPFTLHRTQFPVRLAFAMTINKAQGQSLADVGLDLSLPCFAHGQLYVGLSRATSPCGLRVLLPSGSSGLVPNVVYREILLAAGLLET